MANEELYIKDFEDPNKDLDDSIIDSQPIKCKCMDCGEIFEYYMPPRCPKCDGAYVTII